MASPIDWEQCRSFLAVLAEGSFSGAARALDIAQPTVGRHIAALERVLAMPLFTRSQTGLLPLESALSLRPYLEAMSSAAAALERAASSQGAGVRGVVRVTASEVIGVEVLPSIIARLREENPELQIELVLSNRVQDLLRREADIAVRMTRPAQGLLIARRIGHVDVGLYATKQYLQRHGPPATTSDLQRHTLIGFDQPTAFIRAASKLISLSREAFSIRADSDLSQLALVRSGAGIGFCQVPIGRRDGLVRLLAKQYSLPLDMWIAMHEDLRKSPRCRVTFDALVAGLREHVAGGRSRRATEE
jgi:DNA-binding transcriptional LysR family regulator